MREQPPLRRSRGQRHHSPLTIDVLSRVRSYSPLSDHAGHEGFHRARQLGKQRRRHIGRIRVTKAQDRIGSVLLGRTRPLGQIGIQRRRRRNRHLGAIRDPIRRDISHKGTGTSTEAARPNQQRRIEDRLNRLRLIHHQIEYCRTIGDPDSFPNQGDVPLPKSPALDRLGRKFHQ